MIKLFSTWELHLFIVPIILSGCYYETAFAKASRAQNQTSVAISEIEKIHIHFDKPFYTVGDTIWFKAYLVNAANELTEQSKVLYVDLINESNFVLKSIKVPLAAGLGWADIPLDKELPGGNYRIRAYTHWLRNFGTEYFFQKVIPVSDVFEMQVAANINYSYSGGQLVADLEYKNLDGTPLAEKDIRYTIPKNEKRTISGKGQTDANGNFRIRIDTADLGASGSLTARLKVDADTIFKSFTIPANSSNFDVRFFPEGGELVNNIPSRLGFKVVGAGGLGLKASGYIADESNTKVASFDTGFAGMGMFGFNPQPGRKYTAYVRLDNGIEKPFPLPHAIDKGFVMTVSEDENNVLVKIKANAGLAKGTLVTLQAVSHGKIYVNSSNTLTEAQLVIKILKDDLPTGISRLTLLSAGNLPLAERLVFVDHTDELNITLDSLQENYSLRSKVSPKIRVTDEFGKPVLAHLSMAVVDESKVPYDERDELTILSNLLLSSELKGYIEKPNYYFTDEDEDKKRQLDILMMTQGWRRFEWKDVNAENKYPAESGLSVKGKIVSTLNATSPNATISLLIQGQGDAFTDTTANEKGEFTFENIYFEDDKKLILNAKNSKGKSTVNIKLDPVLTVPEVSPLKVPVSDVLREIEKIIIANSDEDYLAYLKRYLDITKTQLLNEVVVRGIRKRKVENSSNLNGRDATYTFMEEQLQNYNALSEALQSKIPGVIIMGKKAYRVRDMYKSISGPIPMRVFLDGAYMGSDLDEYNLNDIEAVEVLASQYEIGVYGSAVILITTKRGKPKPPGPPLGLLSFSAKGYAPEREFYFPKYNNPNTSYQVRDVRSTIYWNPNILTNNGEDSDISFFTAGKPGAYRFIIEGVDEYGHLGRKVLIKEIK